MDKVKCRCGNDINHAMVSPKAKYSSWGLFWLSLAFSPKPIEISYQCQNCGEIIETTREPELITKYRYSSDIMR